MENQGIVKLEIMYGIKTQKKLQKNIKTKKSVCKKIRWGELFIIFNQIDS